MAWALLATNTLSTTTDTLSITVEDKNFHTFLVHTINSGQTDPRGYFNSDTGNNYANRVNYLGSADDTYGNFGYLISIGPTAPIFIFGYVLNIDTEEKLMISWHQSCLAGATNAPLRREHVGKWANTSNGITEIARNNGDPGDYVSGTNLTAIGTD